MNPEYHAEFLAKIGHQIREHAGALWFDTFSRAYTTIPYDAPVNPADFDAKSLLQTDGLMARFSCDVADGVGSYQHVVADPDYDFSSLISQARNKTRQGLKHCVVEQICPSELGDAGIRLHAETMLRQGRALPHDFEAYWKNYFQAGVNNPCVSAWVARHDSDLAAFLLSFKAGSREYISIVRSSRQKLKFKPNNALLFTFLKTALHKDDVKEVSIGLQSLQPGGESLDLFKRGMGFEERPIGQRIELRSGIAAALPKTLAAFASRTLQILPGGEKRDRLSGALSWYARQPRMAKVAKAA